MLNFFLLVRFCLFPFFSVFFLFSRALLAMLHEILEMNDPSTDEELVASDAPSPAPATLPPVAASKKRCPHFACRALRRHRLCVAFGGGFLVALLVAGLAVVVVLLKMMSTEDSQETLPISAPLGSADAPRLLSLASDALSIDWTLKGVPDNVERVQVEKQTSGSAAWEEVSHFDVVGPVEIDCLQGGTELTLFRFFNLFCGP